MSARPFAVGDRVMARYASTETLEIWSGTVTRVDGDYVFVNHGWDVMDHHASALRHVNDGAL